MSIDVIIPTYKPDKALFELVKRLNGQSLKPENIIIMNTEENIGISWYPEPDFWSRTKI